MAVSSDPITGQSNCLWIVFQNQSQLWSVAAAWFRSLIQILLWGDRFDSSVPFHHRYEDVPKEMIKNGYRKGFRCTQKKNKQKEESNLNRSMIDGSFRLGSRLLGSITSPSGPPWWSRVDVMIELDSPFHFSVIFFFEIGHVLGQRCRLEGQVYFLNWHKRFDSFFWSS